MSTEKRSGIINKPKGLGDPESIARLFEQVITWDLEKVEMVKGLPTLEIGGAHGKS